MKTANKISAFLLILTPLVFADLPLVESLAHQNISNQILGNILKNINSSEFQGARENLADGVSSLNDEIPKDLINRTQEYMECCNRRFLSNAAPQNIQQEFFESARNSATASSRPTALIGPPPLKPAEFKKMGAYIQTLDAESDGLRKFLINSNDGSLNETNYKKLGSAISEYESLHGKNSKISNIFNDLVGGFQTGAANNKIALKGLITDLKHNPEVREALESSTRPGASLRDFLNSKEELKGMGTTFENFGKSLANKESVMADLSNKHQKSVDYFEAKEKAYNQRKTDFEMSRNQTKSSTQKGFEKFQNTANADFFAHEKLDNISEVNIRNEDFRGYKAALDKKGILNKPAEAVKFINEQLTKKRDFILNLAKTANVEADYKRFGGTLKLDNDATKKLANASSTGIKSGNQSTKYKELVNNRVNKLLGPFNPGQDPTVHLKFEEKVKFLKSIDKAVPGKLSSTDSLINLLKRNPTIDAIKIYDKIPNGVRGDMKKDFAKRFLTATKSSLKPTKTDLAAHDKFLKSLPTRNPQLFIELQKSGFSLCGKR